MSKRYETWLVLAALLALGCGGGAVDLGHREDRSWSDVDDNASATEPQAIFEGGMASYTLDGPTLYALVGSKKTLELVSCPLSRCDSERTTLYSRPNDEEGIMVDQLIAAAGTLYWVLINQQRTQILACPTTGCSEPEVLSANWREGLAADEEGAYWIDLQNRLMRRAPATQAPQLVRDLAEEPQQASKLAAHGQYVYFVGSAPGASSVRRIRKDGTSASEVVVDDQRISAFSVTGNAVYYVSQILGGRVASCPLEGCDPRANTVASNQRWPVAIQVDGDEVFWLNNPAGMIGFPSATLASCPLPECSGVEARTARFRLTDSAEKAYFGVNRQAIVWLEPNDSFSEMTLRRLAR